MNTAKTRPPGFNTLALCAIVLIMSISMPTGATWQVTQVHDGLSRGANIQIEPVPWTQRFGIVSSSRIGSDNWLFYHEGLEQNFQATPISQINQIDAVGLAYHPITATPYICYQATDRQYLAHLEDGQWVTELVSANGAEEGCSIAFDPRTNTPSVAYCGDNGVYYAWRQDGVWQNQRVATGFAGQRWPSLQFDPTTGEPTIAYAHTFEGVFLAQPGSDDNWLIEQAASMSFPGYTVLQFDAVDNLPQIASTASASGPIHHLDSDGDAWDMSQVSPGSMWWPFGFDLSPDGDPMVAYVLRGSDNINYLHVRTMNNDQWVDWTEPLAYGNSSYFDGPVDLFVDDTGVHAAYTSWNQGIFYAHQVPEPSTLIALSLGALTLTRRRRN